MTVCGAVSGILAPQYRYPKYNLMQICEFDIAPSEVVR